MKPHLNFGLAFAALILLAGSFAHAQGIRVKNAKLGGGRGKPGVSEALKQPASSLSDSARDNQQESTVAAESAPSDEYRFPIYGGPPRRDRPTDRFRSHAGLPNGVWTNASKKTDPAPSKLQHLMNWIRDLGLPNSKPGGRSQFPKP